MKKILLLATVLISLQGRAQYASVDEYVKKLGPLEDFNVATIADTISRKFPDKQEKARAIFYWIANNIAMDPKAIRSNDTKKNDPVMVVQLRKATALGFATLFQEMCSMANIRCLIIDGYVKNFAEDINNKPDEVNHSWNVVQLGQSPDKWHYVDAAKASGFLDKKMSMFTKNFTSEYFFADKGLFNIDHYPDNAAWYLGGEQKNLSSFYALPVIGQVAYAYGLGKPSPLTGHIKTKNTKPIQFGFQHRSPQPIGSISLLIGEGNKQVKPEPMNFTDNAGTVNFSFTFKKADTYPVRIMVDGKELLQYIVESEE